MIERYSRPAMRQVFSDQSRMDMWLAVEKAALAALVAEGIAPPESFAALEPLTAVDVAAVREREAQIHHDLAAFVDVVAGEAPGAAAWLHWGLTSSDVVDTALALQLQHAGSLVIDQLHAAQRCVLARAHEHRETIMLGRTHGMPAEPITFGIKLAGWWHELRRSEDRLVAALTATAVGKLSGAVGLYSGVPASVEERVLRALNLGRDDSATQIVQRDRHAQLVQALALLASSLERFALEVRHLQRSEVAEAAEPFARTQKGSSAMPHKRNPIVAERICGLARVARANASVALENVVLWHERDISHSSAERVILPDTFLIVDYLLDRFTWLMDGLEVHATRMRRNVDDQKGLVASQRVLLEMTRRGMPRDVAYRIVQRASASVLDGTHTDLAAALSADDQARELLGDQVEALATPSVSRFGLDAAFARLPASS